MIIKALFIISCYLSFLFIPSKGCSFDSNMGATFSLEDLVREGEEPSYFVTDGDIPCTKEVEQNYTYMFNICRDVSGAVPEACSSEAAALQIDKRLTLTDPTDDWCFVAGRYDQATTSLELISDSDPTEGVKLTYVGDDCSHDAEGNLNPTPRKFHLHFTCSSSSVAVPVHAYEYQHCEYTVEIPSIYGLVLLLF